MLTIRSVLLSICISLWRGLTDRIRPSSGGILVRVESERLDRAQSDFLGSRCVSFHRFSIVLVCSCYGVSFLEWVLI